MKSFKEYLELRDRVLYNELLIRRSFAPLVVTDMSSVRLSKGLKKRV